MPNSKSRRYGARTRKRFGTIFSKKMKKNITCPLPMFFALLLYFDT
jgi:hypothetical protein